MKIYNLLVSFYRIYLQVLFAITPGYAAKRAFHLFATPVVKKNRQREIDVLKRAKKTILKKKGLNIHVYEWGEGAKTALLVHGWEGNAGSNTGFVAPLLKAGYKVVAFDGPAHGKSDGKRTNVIHFSKIMKPLFLAHKPELMITHSFGSAATSFMLYNNPDLSLNKLVMVTTPNRIGDIIGEFAGYMRISPKQLQLIFNHLEKRFGRKIKELSVGHMLQKANVKETLIIHGPADRVLSYQYARQVVEEFPRARLLDSPSKGHYRILWDEDTFDKILTFATTPVAEVEE